MTRETQVLSQFPFTVFSPVVLFREEYIIARAMQNWRAVLQANKANATRKEIWSKYCVHSWALLLTFAMYRIKTEFCARIHVFMRIFYSGIKTSYRGDKDIYFDIMIDAAHVISRKIFFSTWGVPATDWWLIWIGGWNEIAEQQSFLCPESESLSLASHHESRID